VAAIDWAPNTNWIVTVSHDRYAYVWTWEQVMVTWQWNPVLVILRMSRAATSVKCIADGERAKNTPQSFDGPDSSPLPQFAVGSGASYVAVCSYDGR
jgi:actin related protein 2/3 complex subunit 1A/1B